MGYAVYVGVTEGMLNDYVLSSEEVASFGVCALAASVYMWGTFLGSGSEHHALHVLEEVESFGACALTASVNMWSTLRGSGSVLRQCT